MVPLSGMRYPHTNGLDCLQNGREEFTIGSRAPCSESRVEGGGGAKCSLCLWYLPYIAPSPVPTQRDVLKVIHLLAYQTVPTAPGVLN